MSELKHRWRTEKILTLEQAAAKAEELRQAGKRIVTLNGAFDILQAGHLDMLEESKQQGDVLFVGMNSDESVKNGKGPERPFVPEEQRAALLAALICVDYIVIIDAPYKQVQDILIETVKPHIHANGGDYGAPETWIEWPVMKKNGVEPYKVERRPGLATSDIVAKIRKSTQENA